MRLHGWALLLVLLATPAAAQVYKCEMPDGGTQYTNQPCEDGEPQELRGISVTPGASPEQQAAMRREQQVRRQAASNERQQRIDTTSEKVRTIQRKNADPERCEAAREAIARVEDLDLARWEFSHRTFEYRNQVNLYCFP